MCKRLFENAKPRYAVQLSKEGKQSKIQDVPKENNIFCTQCEKRLEKLETYISRIFIEINSPQSASRKYEIHLIEKQEILKCVDITPSLFYLFFYSLIWRCSISKHILFDTFNIGKEVEEELRIFLNQNLFESHEVLMANAESINQIPTYYICIVKPKYKTRGIFSAYNFALNSFAIYTVDYALFFYTSETDCLPAHKKVGNLNNEVIRIVLGDDENWKSLNDLVIQNMLNYQNVT